MRLVPAKPHGAILRRGAPQRPISLRSVLALPLDSGPRVLIVAPVFALTLLHRRSIIALWTKGARTPLILRVLLHGDKKGEECLVPYATVSAVIPV